MLSFISNPFIISTWWVIDRSSAHKSRKFYSYRIDPHHLWIDISLWFTTAPPSSPTTGLLSGCVGTMIGIVILKPLFYMLFTILKHSIMLAITKCILHNTKKGGFFFFESFIDGELSDPRKLQLILWRVICCCATKIYFRGSILHSKYCSHSKPMYTFLRESSVKILYPELPYMF